MRLFGHWHAAALAKLPPPRHAPASGGDAAGSDAGDGGGERGGGGGGGGEAARVLALEGGTLEAPLPPQPWATLNALDAVAPSPLPQLPRSCPCLHHTTT